MKRVFVFILSLILLMTALPVYAEGADIQAKVPGEIAEFFAKSKFSGAVIGKDAYVEINDTAAGDFAFAVLSKGNEQLLYGFTRKNGRWEYWLLTGSALPQIAGRFFLQSSSDYRYETADKAIYAAKNPVLTIGFQRLDNEEYWSHTAHYELSGASGHWMLCHIFSYETASHFTNALVYSDHLVFMNDEGKVLGTVYGTVQRNLRYCSFSAFPGSVDAAREKLSFAPALPAGSELVSQNVSFTGGQVFEVYSGPGKNYERAANGNAKVSTNDWIQVFGREGDYVLIQYAISSSQMRFGYINASALPKNANVSALSFAGQNVTLSQSTTMTDDPLKSKTRVRSLIKGDTVTQLAVMGDWAYVEVRGAGSPVRGFVPKSAISAETVYSAAYHSDEYTAEAIARMGNNLTVTVTVTASDAWTRQPENAVTGYTLYANNTPVAACTGSWQSGYTLSTVLPQGTAILGLCPTRNGQIVADEAIIIHLP